MGLEWDHNGNLSKPEDAQRKQLGSRAIEMTRFRRIVLKAQRVLTRDPISWEFAETETGQNLIDALQAADKFLETSIRVSRGERTPVEKKKLSLPSF